MATLLRSPEAVIEAQENFVKSGNRNRTTILAANGPLTLSVPLKGGRDHRRSYRDVILAEEPWRRKHLQTIRSAYGSTPFFEHYFESFETVYLKPTTGLFEFNTNLLQWLLSQLKIREPLRFTSVYEKEIAGIDLRQGNFPEMKAYPYIQAFSHKHGFCKNVSVLDTIFNLGPESKNYLNGII